MRSLVALVVALNLCAASAGAQTKVERGMRLDADGAVRVYNLGGSVKVTGWNRDSIAVRGSVGKGSEFHMGGNRSGMKMFVEDADERNPSSANLEIQVPYKTKLWIKTATASIDIREVSGSLDLYVVSGNITVSGDPSDVNAEAIDGSIRIVGSPEWVRGKSASGSVVFKGNSSDVTLSTVSGKIEAGGMKFEKAKFESVTGNIQFDGNFERGGLINFDTHSGTVNITLASRVPADFDVVSIAGTILNNLTKTPPRPGKYGRGAELETTVGNGGTRVVVRTFKGTVTLKQAGLKAL